jgi:hypothetical protein
MQHSACAALPGFAGSCINQFCLQHSAFNVDQQAPMADGGSSDPHLGEVQAGLRTAWSLSVEIVTTLHTR